MQHDTFVYHDSQCIYSILISIQGYAGRRIVGFIGHASRVPCPVPLSSAVPYFNWYRNSTVIYEITELGHKSVTDEYVADYDTGILTVVNTTYGDAGLYICRLVVGSCVQEYKIDLDLSNTAQERSKFVGIFMVMIIIPLQITCFFHTNQLYVIVQVYFTP